MPIGGARHQVPAKFDLQRRPVSNGGHISAKPDDNLPGFPTEVVDLTPCDGPQILLPTERNPNRGDELEIDRVIRERSLDVTVDKRAEAGTFGRTDKTLGGGIPIASHFFSRRLGQHLPSDILTENVQEYKLTESVWNVRLRRMASAEKIDQILESSLAVFCRYGFGKTTMKDLADAAGISRAALYLHFSNKEDLFRAGSQRAHETVMTEVDSALSTTGPVIDRIDRAMTAYLQGLMEEISSSPHGQELFDSNLAISGDITRESRERLTRRIAQALDEAASAEEIDLTAVDATSTELAGLILATAEGMKRTRGETEKLSDGSSLFMRILGAAISR